MDHALASAGGPSGVCNEFLPRRRSMKVRIACSLVAVAALALSTLQADDLKSGPDKKIAGAFNVKAITGEMQGQELCYVCKYNGEARPAVVLMFSRKADENVA